VYETIICDDYNKCTSDYCDSYEGCKYLTPACLCDDHNACTDDSCDPIVGCINTWTVECNDNDDNTFDYCDISIGCLHRPVGEDEGEEGYEN
jgi:hypothetical protein